MRSVLPKLGNLTTIQLWRWLHAVARAHAVPLQPRARLPGPSGHGVEGQVKGALVFARLWQALGRGPRFVLGTIGLMVLLLMHWGFYNFFVESGGLQMSGGAAAVFIVIAFPWLMAMLWVVRKILNYALTQAQLNRRARGEFEEASIDWAKHFTYAYEAEKAKARLFWSQTTIEDLQRYGQVNYEAVLAREREINAEVDEKFSDTDKVLWFTRLAEEEGLDPDLIFDYWRVPQIELLGAKGYMSTDAPRAERLKDEELSRQILLLREEQTRRQQGA